MAGSCIINFCFMLFFINNTVGWLAGWITETMKKQCSFIIKIIDCYKEKCDNSTLSVYLEELQQKKLTLQTKH